MEFMELAEAPDQGLTRDRLGKGGGGRFRPLRFFLYNVRNTTDVDAKLGIPFLTSI